MSCSLLKIPSLSAERLDAAYVCEARKMVAVATPDLKLKVFSFPDWASEPASVREFKHHSGAILDLAFAPIRYHAYLASVGYDKTLHLYNLDDHKATEPVFSFTQEDPAVGYFTAVAFVPSDKARLTIAAGTSTGHLLIFDSQANFEPRTHQLFTAAIKSVAGSTTGELAVAAPGYLPKLVHELDFEQVSDFPENGQALTKTAHLKFSGGFSKDDKAWLVTGCEDHTVGIWELDESLKILKPIQTVDVGAPILGLNWNIGARSATVFCGKKDDKVGDLKAFKVTAMGSADEGHWEAYGLEVRSE